MRYNIYSEPVNPRVQQAKDFLNDHIEEISLQYFDTLPECWDVDDEECPHTGDYTVWLECELTDDDYADFCDDKVNLNWFIGYMPYGYDHSIIKCDNNIIRFEVTI